MIKNLIIFDILASSIKHTLINWQEDDQHQDEAALHDVLDHMDHEDITMQPAEIKGKTIDEILSFKHQKMEELKAEIEELEEQKTQDDLGKNVFPAKSEILQEDYNSDYVDKFLEYEDNSKIQEQDDEEATITIEEESVNNDDIEIKNDELEEEEDKGCDGPEFDYFYGEFCPKEYRAKRDATEDFLGGILKTGEKLLDGNIGG